VKIATEIDLSLQQHLFLDAWRYLRDVDLAVVDAVLLGE